MWFALLSTQYTANPNLSYGRFHSYPARKSRVGSIPVLQALTEVDELGPKRHAASGPASMRTGYWRMTFNLLPRSLRTRANPLNGEQNATGSGVRDRRQSMHKRAAQAHDFDCRGRNQHHGTLFANGFIEHVHAAQMQGSGILRIDARGLRKLIGVLTSCAAFPDGKPSGMTGGRGGERTKLLFGPMARLQDAVDLGPVFLDSTSPDSGHREQFAGRSRTSACHDFQRPIAKDTEGGHATSSGFGQAPGAQRLLELGRRPAVWPCRPHGWSRLGNGFRARCRLAGRGADGFLFTWPPD